MWITGSFFLLLFLQTFIFAQNFESESNRSRGSIPEELLRPRRGEAPRFPVDTIIGELGQGKASGAAYAFARTVAEGLVSGMESHSGLATLDPVTRGNYLSVLEPVDPRSFRIGSGREEADGAFSFLVRFIGREQAIAGELYVRQEEKRSVNTEENPEDEQAAPEVITRLVWVFDELILEQARTREKELEETKQRFDFPPYQRFF